MSERRTLLIGGVSLTKGRVKEAGLAMKEICDELEPVLKGMGFTDNAPFRTVSLIIRFGEKTDLTPDYDPINKRFGELPVAVEMAMSGLRAANREAVKSALVKVVIEVLMDIAQKYDLPCQPLKEIEDLRQGSHS